MENGNKLSDEETKGLLCSRKDHCERIDTFRPVVTSLERHNVREPVMPVGAFIQEGNLLVLRAKDEEEQLRSAGMPARFIEDLQLTLDVLRSAQTVLQAEKATRTQSFDRVVERAQKGRFDALAASELAFRLDEVSLRRVAEIRSTGDHVDDLVAVLLGLSVLLTDDPAPFQVLGMDVKAMSLELAAVARELDAALALHRSSSKSPARDLRDRIYSVAQARIAELRAFASFVFRNDRTGTRRAAFSSEWVRARNRAQRRRKAAAVEAVPAEAAPATSPAPVVAVPTHVPAPEVDLGYGLE